MLWLDLNTSFDWSNNQVKSIAKPQNVVSAAGGVCFSQSESDTTFLEFGGLYTRDHSNNGEL